MRAEELYKNEVPVQAAGVKDLALVIRGGEVGNRIAQLDGVDTDSLGGGDANV